MTIRESTGRSVTELQEARGNDRKTVRARPKKKNN